MKIIKNIKKYFFSDKLEIIKAVKKKNSLLSNSLKTNILTETFKNKILRKRILINSVSLNSKDIKKKIQYFSGLKVKNLMETSMVLRR